MPFFVEYMDSYGDFVEALNEYLDLYGVFIRNLDDNAPEKMDTVYGKIMKCVEALIKEAVEHAREQWEQEIG